MQPGIYEAHFNLNSIQVKLNTWFLSHTTNILRFQYPQRLAATTLDSTKREHVHHWEGALSVPGCQRKRQTLGEHLSQCLCRRTVEPREGKSFEQGSLASLYPEGRI